jgi:Na+/H+ antiporter NhaC
VNLTTSVIPTRFLLVGIFFISAFLSLAIGSAVGTIASIGPLAAELCLHTQGSLAPIAMGATVGGAFFGDNLSVISDTTVVAVSSQGADARKKLKINLRMASIATVITVLILWRATADISVGANTKDFSLLLPLPYVAILALAICRVNVLACLITGIAIAGVVGCFSSKDYGLIEFSNNVANGFRNVNGTMLLAMMFGGLSGLEGNATIKEVGRRIAKFMARKKKANSSLPQFVIGALATISTVFFANNVLAIIFCGGTAREIAKNNGISPHYSATN